MSGEKPRRNRGPPSAFTPSEVSGVYCRPIRKSPKLDRGPTGDLLFLDGWPVNFTKVCDLDDLWEGEMEAYDVGEHEVLIVRLGPEEVANWVD